MEILQLGEERWVGREQGLADSWQEAQQFRVSGVPEVTMATTRLKTANF